MNNASIFTLKVLRKLYTKAFGGYKLPILQREEDRDKISDMIYELLSSDRPCMIARFGANELNAIINYLCVTSDTHSIIKYIKGKQFDWWWNNHIMRSMQNNAGFYPANAENMQCFGELMINDSKYVDVLGSWQKNEFYLNRYLPKNIVKVDRDNINPFFSKRPWTKYLKGKKVLVIHPFAKSIEKQYLRRDKLFSNPDILPEFELKTIQAVQSIGGICSEFYDWFEALSWMKSEMDKTDYEVCLIGCGAYGFPLAAYAKRCGKQAIHLGGSLQLYFGIKGKRWEGKGYKDGPNDYSKLFNKYWIRPSAEETPAVSKNIENNCYW